MIKQVKRCLRYQLIDKNPMIKEAYGEYSEKVKGTSLRKRFVRIKKLLELNMKNRNLEFADANRENKPSPNELAELLLKYDVISFDIFDTLIFRNMYRPIDAFLILETRYQTPYFQELRIKAECQARSRSCNGEVCLLDIYNEIAKMSNLDIEIWMKREIEMEMELCVINPYMKAVVDILRKSNKKIIAVSDMYLRKEQIESMLKKLGYQDFDEIFVSCDYGESKASSNLYACVDKKLPGFSKIHIGDNWGSDIVMAQKSGWSTFYYPNVNRLVGIGNSPNRTSALTGNIAKGIANRFLNSGAINVTDYYKYGFLNAGLLTCGYCTWLNKIAKEKHVDKLLFVARDGFIVQKVYDSFYNEIPHEYVLFSRFCAQQILFEKNIDRYIAEILIVRSEQKNKISIENAFKESGLDFLIERLTKRRIDSKMLLTKENITEVRDFIYYEKNFIIEKFAKVQELAYCYYKELIGEARNVMLVDIGWSGTCGMALKYLLEEKYKTGINVTCALIGAADHPSVEARIADETLFAYVFSPKHNCDLMDWHMKEQMTVHNILLEVLFTAPQPSFLKFDSNRKNSLCFLYGYEEQDNYKIINEMHQGILGFATLWNHLPDAIKEILPISGNDAYASFRHFADNRKSCYNLFKDYKISQLSGIFGEVTIQTIGQIMHENKYI